MEDAQRNRQISFQYVKAAQNRLVRLTQNPGSTVQEFVYAHSRFIECFNRYENTQHKYERVIPDSLLNAECIKAFDIRAKFSDFTNYIDDLIRQKSSTNPFANTSNPFLNASNNSFETSSDIFSVVTGPDPNVVAHNTNSVPFTTPLTRANNDPWQPIQNHNQNTIRQNLNFATPLQTVNQNVTSTGVLNSTNLPTLDTTNFTLPNFNSNLPVFGRAPGSSGLQTLLSVAIVININLTLILNVNMKCIPGFALPSP